MTTLQFDSIFETDNAQQSSSPYESYPPNTLVKITLKKESPIHPSKLEETLGKNPFRDEPDRDYIHGYICSSAPELNALMIYLYDPDIPKNAQYTGQLMLSIDEIESMHMLSPPSQSTSAEPIASDILNDRYKKAFQQRTERAALINPRVSGRSQQLFITLSKTLRCRWQGDDIIVNDNVIISSPHRISNVHPYDPSKKSIRKEPTNQAAFDHIYRLVKSLDA